MPLVEQSLYSSYMKVQRPYMAEYLTVGGHQHNLLQCGCTYFTCCISFPYFCSRVRATATPATWVLPAPHLLLHTHPSAPLDAPSPHTPQLLHPLVSQQLCTRQGRMSVHIYIHLPLLSKVNPIVMSYYCSYYIKIAVHKHSQKC